VEICQLHTEGDAPYANPDFTESFHVNFFIGKNLRHTLKEGNGSYTPVFFSEVPLLFKRNIVNLNVALIHVSVP
jgi:acyl-CoA hydrolase